MRTIYVCLGCANLYLPPEAMTYPSLGVAASPVHCSLPSCRRAVEESLQVMGVSEDVAARMARRAAGLEGPVRMGRPGRLARGRRSAAGPGATRDKLR
ncbi:hypothetical protein ACWCQL_11525 [Streptomyces sp. NPDC002073]|uniref:hypothetical protein n=1 Tax=Streptomyces sp. NBC_00239 TaxID=2903640 RepID=UPI002E2CD3E4|nr:hypothetical protein [Streptomyces sp. NBC_00239]